MVLMQRQKMKDVLLRARVVVRTSNTKISRRHLADYVKTLHQKACSTSTMIFPCSTNHIVDLWRCRCRVTREFKTWRWQRQRHKAMIWLVEWRKIIVLQVRHAFGAMFWRSLPNDDVKFSYLRFWRQRELAAVNLLLFAFSWKSFVPS